MHWRCTILAVLITSLAAQIAFASDGRWTLEGKSPDEIARHFALKNHDGCLQFVDESAVEYHTQRWHQAIRAMAEADPEYVFAWFIGAAAPPASVIEESRRQKDCMIEAMVAEAERFDNELTLDWGDRRSQKSEMRDVARRYMGRGFRKKLHDRITRSDYRDARAQGWIWRQKFLFKSNSFNRISPTAAERCDLTAGYTWKPALDLHRACWFGKLDEAEREREILGASSAPGISRHHWGTEFDLFSLNPHNFVGDARMADEYQWLRRNSSTWGFYQPYSARRDQKRPGYMEERWHWSYYPVAQALLEFGEENERKLTDAMEAQWKSLETRWNKRHRAKREFFRFVRANWRHYVFNVDRSLRDPAIDETP